MNTGPTLHLADCMDVMRQMPDRAFDLAIVDPPYGRFQNGGLHRTHMVSQPDGSKRLCVGTKYSKKNWDNEPASPEYFRELRRVSKHQIIWGVNYYDIALPGGRIIWDKVNDGADQCAAEIAYCSLNDRVAMVRYMWRGMMQGLSIRQGTVQQGNKALNEKRIHPTQKPVKLYEWLLQQYAQPGWRILDTHMGSGSSVIACLNTGHEITAIEVDAEYYAKANERIRLHQQQATMKLS